MCKAIVRQQYRRRYTLANSLLALWILLPACDKSRVPTGFQVVSLANPASAPSPQQYVAFVPQPQPLQPLLPVLLFLNGFGENGSDGLFQLSNNFGQDLWRRRNQLPMLVVSPQCAEGGDWTADSAETEYALRCLDDAIERFGGDPNRVYITGVSAGGDGVMKLISAYPERFVAAMPVSCGTSGDPAQLAAAGMPIRCLANRFDKMDLISGLRQSRVQWLGVGLSPVVTEINGLKSASHNAWDEAYNAPVSFWWLMQQGRTGATQPAMMRLYKASDVLATWHTNSEGAWHAESAVDKTEELVSSAQKPAWLVSPAQDGDAELHVDAFLSGTMQVRLAVLVNDSAPAESIEFMVELPEAGAGGVRGMDGQWLNSLEPPAQQALLEGWNDIRLVCQGNSVQLEINGWPAASVPDAGLGQSFHWALLTSETHSTRFRFLRMGPQ